MQQEIQTLGPDSRKIVSLKSEIFVSNVRFFSDLRHFAQLGFTKDLRLRIFSIWSQIQHCQGGNLSFYKMEYM